VVPVFALAGFIACNDDSNPTGPGSIGSSDTGTANALTYGVAIPLVQNLVLENYLNLAPNPGGPLNACQTLDVCSSGSATVCSDPGALSVTFAGCQLPTTSIDGTVNLTLTAGGGTGPFTLTVGGDFSMTGTVSFTQDQTCFSQSFTEVVITTPDDLVINMNGYVEWCDPRVMVGNVTLPTYASFVFEVPSLGRVVDVSVYADPPGSLNAIVLNASRTVILITCDGNITGNSLACYSAQ